MQLQQHSPPRCGCLFDESNGFLPRSKQPVSVLVAAVVAHVQLQPPNPSERVAHADVTPRNHYMSDAETQ